MHFQTVQAVVSSSPFVVPPTEQRLCFRRGAVVQPQGDGMAAIRGSGRIRSQPAGQRSARGPDRKNLPFHN